MENLKLMVGLLPMRVMECGQELKCGVMLQHISLSVKGAIQQGMITITNEGTIENAEIGVLLGARDPETQSGFDESKGGGIIQVPYGGNPQDI